MPNEILTPSPPPEPRINGARVFGVRPGNPLLFKVAASGSKPIRYAANGLPAGATIDETTGIISGCVHVRGSYPVSVSAANEYGVARRTLHIEVGDEICLTPPMGWNSWYCHSELVGEDAVRTTAKAMVDTGLIDHGWTYVNIDDCWQGQRGGQYHAIQPNERFHDMKAMCAYVHGLGLKPGIYSTPWIGTYAGFIGGSALDESGDNSASHLPEEQRLQQHQVFGRYPGTIDKNLNRVGHWFFDRDARQFAEWGFDYIKVDWQPNDGPTTRRIHEDLFAAGRDIVLSLSNAAPYENALELARYANCWRTTGDIYDQWTSILKIMLEQEKWQRFSRPGHWNDPDMLQVGCIATPNRQNTEFKTTRLTADEQYTQMSLWSMLAAPLLLSCDVASLDEFTLALLTNDEVIDVNQDPAALTARRISCDDDGQVWARGMEDGSVVIGLFNTSDDQRRMDIGWQQIGLPSNQHVRDLWRQRDLGASVDSFCTTVNPHGVVLIKANEI